MIYIAAWAVCTFAFCVAWGILNYDPADWQDELSTTEKGKHGEEGS